MKFIRYPQLRDEYGIDWTRVHLNRLIKAGKFPAPVQLGGNSIAWVKTEIDEWTEQRAADRKIEIPEAA